MTFDEIYKLAASSQTRANLNSILTEEVWLDVKETSPPFYTPAGKLAFEGNDAAVEGLKSLGANMNHIAFGYAAAGNIKKVNECLTQGVNANWVFAGYAFGGYDEKVDNYRMHHPASTTMIICGYILAGNNEKVAHYLQKHDADIPFPFDLALCAGQTKNNSIIQKIRDHYELRSNVIESGVTAGLAYAGENSTSNNLVHSIAFHCALAGRHDMVEECRLKGANVDKIAKGYAATGNHEKVQTYLTTHHASLDWIAAGYAKGGYHSQVEVYHKKGAQERPIALAYAYAGDSKIEEYLVNYPQIITTNVLARVFADIGNHQKVDECLIQGNKNTPMCAAVGYASSHHHDKVENLRRKHNIPLKRIAEGYQASQYKIPLLYQAINILSQQGKVAKPLIEVLERLKKGSDKRYHPYWMNSSSKLTAIAFAVIDWSNQDTSSLDEEIKNPDSKLHAAINKPRITRLSIFGGLRCNQARSLVNVLAPSPGTKYKR